MMALGWAVRWEMQRKRENMVDWVRKELDNKKLFAEKGVKCYVYSKEDELVMWEDVEKHADGAERRNWRVKRERFKGSKHIGHMLVDKERYWEVVRATWEEGVATGN